VLHKYTCCRCLVGKREVDILRAAVDWDIVTSDSGIPMWLACMDSDSLVSSPRGVWGRDKDSEQLHVVRMRNLKDYSITWGNNSTVSSAS